MTTPEVIRSLIEKVEVGSGHDRPLDVRIEYAFNNWADLSQDEIEDSIAHIGVKGSGWTPPEYDFPAYCSSIDAAVALTEKLLPGWNWGVIEEHDTGEAKPCQGNVYPSRQPFEAHLDIFGYAPSPPRALLSATLRAKLATMTDALTTEEIENLEKRINAHDPLAVPLLPALGRKLIDAALKGVEPKQEVAVSSEGEMSEFDAACDRVAQKVARRARLLADNEFQRGFEACRAKAMTGVAHMPEPEGRGHNCYATQQHALKIIRALTPNPQDKLGESRPIKPTPQEAEPVCCGAYVAVPDANGDPVPGCCEQPIPSPTPAKGE